MQRLSAMGRGFFLSPTASRTPQWLRAAREAGNQAVLAGKGTVDDLQRMLGGSFKEHAARQGIADRMVAGTLHVPRPKPVGFSDVSSADWADLSRSFDRHDALRRAAGM